MKGTPDKTVSRAKTAKNAKQNKSKHEIRNSKQFQMTKIPNFQTNSIPHRSLEFSPILDLFGRLFVSDFEIRISDLSFLGLSPSAGVLSIFGFWTRFTGCLAG